jgi:hypothetical protein
MVKDNWSSSSTTAICANDNQSTQHDQYNAISQQDRTHINDNFASDDSKSTNTNPWGVYDSRENFINLHLC